MFSFLMKSQSFLEIIQSHFGEADFKLNASHYPDQTVFQFLDNEKRA